MVGRRRGRWRSRFSVNPESATNYCVPLSELRAKTTLEPCGAIKSHSAQTIRMTKVSLNHGSDNLYASWRAGTELLAHVWGSEKWLEGMRAFVEKRKPDFRKFRLQNKKMIDEYLAGVDMNSEDHLK
jgi:1,4-dihydroxy-2-naphthoyl-CoA synthase